jgi:hypothetical protein
MSVKYGRVLAYQVHPIWKKEGRKEGRKGRKKREGGRKRTLFEGDMIDMITSVENYN